MKKKIGIIGAGVVGTAVGVVLKENGFEITGVYDRKTESTEQLVARTGGKACSTPREVSHLADILFITTSDTAIAAVVDQLVADQAVRSGQILIHMSGAQTTEVMDKSKIMGARVLSVHPLQSFARPEQAMANLPGSVFSIEGDAEAYDEAIKIVEALGGEYFFIDREAKVLYHAGACVVSNYLVTVVDMGVKLLVAAGIPSPMAVRALLPLIMGTVNNIEKIGVPQALTGPIARGDQGTVIKHLERMQTDCPELVDLYRWLGAYTARVAVEKGSIDAAMGAQLKNMMFQKNNEEAVVDS